MRPPGNHRFQHVTPQANARCRKGDPTTSVLGTTYLCVFVSICYVYCSVCVLLCVYCCVCIAVCVCVFLYGISTYPSISLYLDFGGYNNIPGSGGWDPLGTINSSMSLPRPMHDAEKETQKLVCWEKHPLVCIWFVEFWQGNFREYKKRRQQ